MISPKSTTPRRGHLHHLRSPHRLNLSVHCIASLASAALALALLVVSAVTPVLTLLTSADSSAGHVADMCASGPVETAAEVLFADGVRRLWVSSGPYYWLINVTDERPEVASAAKIPFEFLPDVALLKNSSACSSSGRQSPVSLVLIQVKKGE